MLLQVRVVYKNSYCTHIIHYKTILRCVILNKKVVCKVSCVEFCEVQCFFNSQKLPELKHKGDCGFAITYFIFITEFGEIEKKKRQQQSKQSIKTKGQKSNKTNRPTRLSDKQNQWNKHIYRELRC